MNKQITNILFLCWGNICRSPFAGALFTKLSDQNNRKDLTGDSAGLFALHGNSATHMAQKVAAEYGVDLTRHSAKPVSRQLVDWSDLILVMTKSHRDTLSENFPEAAEKTRLIKQFARFGSRERGIADPYGLNYEAYRFCFLDIEDAVKGLIDFLSDSAVAS
ncbi:low molecular weight protein arginine phosphatase [Thermodesulfobacteriota bacterium]